MMPHKRSRTQPLTRFSSRACGAGHLVAPLLLAISLVLATPARAHHDIDDHPEQHAGMEPASFHDRADPDEPHDHYLAHAYGEERPHQHTYTHTHWHTHVLEDGTIIHHKHPHSHTYWHYGPDETEEERVTRVEPDREKAPPNQESPGHAPGGPDASADTRFVKPGQSGSGPAPSLY